MLGKIEMVCPISETINKNKADVNIRLIPNQTINNENISENMHL